MYIIGSLPRLNAPFNSDVTISLYVWCFAFESGSSKTELHSLYISIMNGAKQGSNRDSVCAKSLVKPVLVCFSVFVSHSDGKGFRESQLMI